MAKKKGKKAMKSKRTSSKKVIAKKRTTKKRSSKKPAVKKKVGNSARKAIGKAPPSRPTAGGSNRSRESEPFELETKRPRSGGQSGDLQGLSETESADSESVGELLDEGNAFEADVVAGVEHADDDEEREVHTREVPEDDVPEEYLDKD